MTRSLFLSLLLSTFSLTSCGGTKESDSNAETDADADADSDTDTDSDSDGDTDACPAGSGWPCTCDPQQTKMCDDGNYCIAVDGMSSSDGVCGATCDGQGSMCPGTSYDGVPVCFLSDGTDWWCMLICTSDDDCPSDQRCQLFSGFPVCYPAG